MEKEAETIVVNGKTYYSKKDTNVEHSGEWKVIILQRGWVIVGKMEREGSQCKVHNASVVRNWGTTKGLGELVNGPTESTKLDPCHGVVEFDYLTMIASIAVNGELWSKL